jgi:hypothetical protein
MNLMYFGLLFDSECLQNWSLYVMRDFFVFLYVIQHCFICQAPDSTVSKDAKIKPQTVATFVIGSQTL